MSETPRDRTRASLADLDRRIAARGVTIWVGAEPTFTRRDSSEPWWLWQAEGGDKLERAEAVAAALAERIAGATAKPIPGRLYPGEETPRFCLEVRWPASALTVTPDPGVVEVNTAPCADGASFLDHLRDVYGAADDAGLAPLRYRYNGDTVCSGGGGQITLGGPTPETSPFFTHPTLLPRLVRYVNNHPSLSYWFLGECAGSASQSPRADEGVRERWEELRLACRTLESHPARPEALWASLAMLLVDAAGNSHRAELNIEKLWNPHLEGRGRLGCVELRAFRMAPTPEQLAAAAALVRAVAARCAVVAYDEPFVDWGAALHDRMALPLFLLEDLQAVLRDLDAAGLGLGPELEALATSYREPTLWCDQPFPGVTVTLSRALEFWPLVGDVASQERAASRLVDASSERLELRIELPAVRGQPWVQVAGRTVVPRCARVEPERTVWVVGLRRRLYQPSPGLHPSVPPLDPLIIHLRDQKQEVALRIHAWRPDGGGYDGLPANADEATRRRAERMIVTPAAAAPPDRSPHELLHPETWTVDLRAAEALLEDRP